MHMFAWTKKQATLYIGIILGCAGIVSIIVFVFIKILSRRYVSFYIMTLFFNQKLLTNFLICHWKHMLWYSSEAARNPMSRDVRKYTSGHVRPAKIRISLCIRCLVRIFTGRILYSQRCKVFHYQNTPIQIYWKFNHQKWKFSDNNSDIFHISAQNIDCAYSLEPPW